jgi:RHS repeat-associated protein
MTSMLHLQQMEWDFEDQLHYVEKGTEEIYYVYDAAGQRVRKVVEKNNGALIEERIYLGGFEVFRRSNGNGLKLERETLHIMDDQQRIALVETRTKGDDDSPEQLVRYQLGNHLGSSSLELDEDGVEISYEEYYPYGSTSYQAVNKEIKAAAKRYRYTGKEQDDETGLYYYGARYYAAWLGRWVGCDPAGFVNGINLYAYTKNNPIIYIDNDGRVATYSVEKKDDITIVTINLKIYLTGNEAKDDYGPKKIKQYIEEFWGKDPKTGKNGWELERIEKKYQVKFNVAVSTEDDDDAHELKITTDDFERYGKAYTEGDYSEIPVKRKRNVMVPYKDYEGTVYEKEKNRVRNVILHEIGHALGLPEDNIRAIRFGDAYHGLNPKSNYSFEKSIMRKGAPYEITKRNINMILDRLNLQEGIEQTLKSTEVKKYRSEIKHPSWYDISKSSERAQLLRHWPSEYERLMKKEYPELYKREVELFIKPLFLDYLKNR